MKTPEWIEGVLKNAIRMTDEEFSARQEKLRRQEEATLAALHALGENSEEEAGSEDEVKPEDEAGR